MFWAARGGIVVAFTKDRKTGIIQMPSGLACGGCGYMLYVDQSAAYEITPGIEVPHDVAVISHIQDRNGDGK